MRSKVKNHGSIDRIAERWRFLFPSLVALMNNVILPPFPNNYSINKMWDSQNFFFKFIILLKFFLNIRWKIRSVAGMCGSCLLSSCMALSTIVYSSKYCSSIKVCKRNVYNDSAKSLCTWILCNNYNSINDFLNLG